MLTDSQPWRRARAVIRVREDFRVLSSVRDPGTSDYEYRQRVRRYMPSSLLPLIAAAAARYHEQEQWLNSPFRKYTPWALADAARVCLGRRGTVGGRPGLRRLLVSYFLATSLRCQASNVASATRAERLAERRFGELAADQRGEGARAERQRVLDL